MFEISPWSIKQKNALQIVVCPVDSIFKMCVNVSSFRRVHFS